jgi:FAD/FMN-containing dehydrogenase
MNRILWVDLDNMLVRLEAGIVGSQLETAVRGIVAWEVFSDQV